MDIIDIVKRKKIKNLIISIIVIILCLIDFFINIDNYFIALNNKYKKINSISDITNDNKYFCIDMQPSIQNNYNLKSDDLIFNMYTLKLDNENILIILKENTILTDKTEVQILDTNETILQLNDKFEKSNYKYILTNINFNENLKIDKYKAYFLILIMLIFILSIINNLIGVLNPESTRMYKKLNNNTDDLLK